MKFNKNKYIGKQIQLFSSDRAVINSYKDTDY